ncbi:MAG TPA: ligase-associated DNA damage response exonuclease [Chloroflexaceae bacterium]|nr:ligase-associated DNA damage response exonuclease [Chloroflexaceae bacterium]
MHDPLIQLSEHGLYCAPGDFYIDPWAPVPRAVITHAHSDHARWGSRAYLGSAAGAGALRLRLGPDAAIQTLPYGEALRVNDVELSLHPAGHILGSAQVRVARAGEVWVISGDYKTEPDSTCAPFEPVRCHTFVTEATFALPIYSWEPQAATFAAINAWWRANQAAGRASLLLGYALGKAQRLLAGLDPAIGPILCHGAVQRLNQAYRDAGVALPPTGYAGEPGRGFDWTRAMIVAPPSAHGTPWTRRFGELSAGFASGWMLIRGARRRRAVDRGFVLSDHADWPGLLAAIAATGAERVWVTHGYTAVLARWLEEQGLQAYAVPTRYEGEGGGAAEDEQGAEP